MIVYMCLNGVVKYPDIVIEKNEYMIVYMSNFSDIIITIIGICIIYCLYNTQ